MSVLIFLIPPWDLLVLETERYDINSSKGKFYSFVYSFNKPAVGNYSITVPGMIKGAEGLEVTKIVSAFKKLAISCRRQVGRERISGPGGLALTKVRTG